MMQLSAHTIPSGPISEAELVAAMAAIDVDALVGRPTPTDDGNLARAAVTLPPSFIQF